MKIRLHIGYINSKGAEVAAALGTNFWCPTPLVETKLDKHETRKALQLGLTRAESVKWAKEYEFGGGDLSTWTPRPPVRGALSDW